jgi:hypothetical protein
MVEIQPIRILKRHGHLHVSGAHEAFRGALALVRGASWSIKSAARPPTERANES